MRVKKKDLGPLRQINGGTFGRIYDAPQFRLKKDPAAQAYKEFICKHTDQARAAQAAVDLWNSLDIRDRADFDEHMSWPKAVVEDERGVVCGLLMPLLHQDFFCQQVDPDTRQLTDKPREMSWLIATQAQRSFAQVDLPDIDRTERQILLAKLIYAIGRLHKHGWVYGDLSFRNAAFALNPPRIQLLDCDGAAPLSDGQRKQSHTPYWEPPECKGDQSNPQDTVTDVYKLGLALLRCLTPGKGAASSSDPARLAGELDAEGQQVVERALLADRSLRPTAKEMFLSLSRLLAPLVAPPPLRARLVHQYRLRGQDVRIEWQLGNADHVVIAGANQLRLQVDTHAHPDGYVFRPEASGPITVEARNRFGSSRLDLGEVELYELPPFLIGEVHLPQPVVPTLPAFTPDPVMAAVRNRPAVEIGRSDVPRPWSVDVNRLVGLLSPAGRVPVAWPRVDTAVIEASSEVRTLVLTGADEFLSTLRRSLTQDPS